MQGETTCLSSAATLSEVGAATSIPEATPEVDTQGEPSLQMAAQVQSHQNVSEEVVVSAKKKEVLQTKPGIIRVMSA